MTHRFVLFWWALVAALCAHAADTAVGPEAAPSLRSLGEQWIQAQSPAAGDSLPVRLEVTVGEIDARLRLAPCRRIEPFLPEGTRLWGSSRVGLRCADGPVRWTAYLPVTVRAWGPAWLLRHPVSPGAAVTEADLVQGEADWAAQPTLPVQQPADWQGRVAAIGLRTGDALRPTLLRALPLFGPGQTVRLRLEGPGYAVSADAVALGAGHKGQPVQVRAEGGRILAAVVVDAQTVRAGP